MLGTCNLRQSPLHERLHIHVQAYFVVKAAQEREELQRQGDQLNKDVQRAETEVAGLQAALMQLAGSNLEMSAGLK